MRPALPVAIVVIALARHLSAQAGAGAPAALPAAPGARVVTISPPEQRGNEPGIAVNPRDPTQVLAVYQGEARAAYSRDGGATFTPAEGTQPAGWRVAGDVSTTFDARGRAYLSCLVFDSLGTTSYWAHGARRNGILVRRSDDGGRTWGEPVAVKAFPTGREPDIQWEDMPRIFADNQPRSPHAGNVYEGWIEWRLSSSVMLFARSSDGGRTWSAPLRLSDLDAAKIACDNPYLSVDARGRLHAVWTQFRLPIGWPPVGSYYRRSDDGGRTWLPGREVAGEGNGQISVIARGADEVHLVWTAVDTGDRMHSRSPDGGTTWSPPLAIGNGVRGAFTRGLALAFDGGGGLHLVTSTGDLGGEQPIVHTVWDGTAWAEPERISARVAGARPKGLPSLAIGGGNVLHVAYKADDEAIWYTQHKIAAPAIAARPVPTRVTDLWTRAADTSLPFRVLVIVLVFLGGEATVSWLRRRQRETRS